jgi:hypothetical protein
MALSDSLPFRTVCSRTFARKTVFSGFGLQIFAVLRARSWRNHVSFSGLPSYHRRPVAVYCLRFQFMAATERKARALGTT